MGQYFRPATLLAAENFAKYLDDLEAVKPTPALRLSSESMFPDVMFLDVTSSQEAA